MKLVIRSAANKDIAEAIEFYEFRRAGLGFEFKEQFEIAADLLCRQPRMGKAIAGWSGLRQFPLSRFPFRITYRCERNELIVLAVVHQQRKPDYQADSVQEAPAPYQLAA